MQHFSSISLLVRSLCVFGFGMMFFPRQLPAQCTTTGLSAATSYAANNGGRGIMFNITASTTITISCFDANIFVGATGNYEVYYKPGTYAGFETDASAWTLAGGPVGLSSPGSNAAIPIPIAVNAVIPAGETYGFYVTATTIGGLNYISGNALGNVIASDANLTVTAGPGKVYPFSTSFGARDANVTVHYQLGAVFISLPVDLTAFTAEAAGSSIGLRWVTARETNNAYFTLERSADALEWEVLEQVTGAGNSDQSVVYEVMDSSPLTGVSYYRLSQTDVDGVRHYFGLRSVELSGTLGQGKVFPNPVKDLFTIQAIAGARIRVYDAPGRQVLDAQVPEQESSATLSLSTLPAGVYQVEVTSNGVRTVRPVVKL